MAYIFFAEFCSWCEQEKNGVVWKEISYHSDKRDDNERERTYSDFM
jgi:hypothetical protein